VPAQVAVGGGVLVAAGVLVAGATVGLRALSSSGTTGSASSVADGPRTPLTASPESGLVAGGMEDGAGTPSGIKRAPATKINLCGGTLAEVAPSATGLTLTPHFPDAQASAISVTGTVTMTNTSSEPWSGSTASSPVITLSQHGIVLWHTSVLDDSARVIDLAPGESTEYTAHLRPVVCGVEDDSGAFRADLPHVEPGDYQVSAAIDVPADEVSDLVTGSQQTITLK
jgi:hypothetical protein